MPVSSLAPLSVPAQATKDEPDKIHAIWGMTINLANTTKAFRKFVKGFKPKYCVAHDRSLGLPTKAVPSTVEVFLYNGYLRLASDLTHLPTLIKPSVNSYILRSPLLFSPSLDVVVRLASRHCPETCHQQIRDFNSHSAPYNFFGIMVWSLSIFIFPILNLRAWKLYLCHTTLSAHLPFDYPSRCVPMDHFNVTKDM
jgi:hypothetical protein